MNEKSGKVGKVLLAIIEIIVGIFLLISPDKFTTVIIVGFGIILAVIGLVDIINYFLKSPLEAAVTDNLTKGLVEIIIGFFFIIKRKWLLVTFPLLTIVYGVITLFLGIKKLAITINLIRLKAKKWGWVLFSAIITILCAIIILCNPFSSITVLWVFVAISLIVEAIIDIFITLFSKDKTI